MRRVQHWTPCVGQCERNSPLFFGGENFGLLCLRLASSIRQRLLYVQCTSTEAGGFPSVPTRCEVFSKRPFGPVWFVLFGHCSKRYFIPPTFDLGPQGDLRSRTRTNCCKISTFPIPRSRGNPDMQRKSEESWQRQWHSIYSSNGQPRPTYQVESSHNIQ